MLIAAGAAEVKPRSATTAGNLLSFIVEIFRSSSHLRRHVSISGAYVRLEGEGRGGGKKVKLMMPRERVN